MTRDQWLFAAAMFLVAAGAVLPVTIPAAPRTVMRFPAHQARDVNPDTHLVLTFPSAPALGKTGKIRIFDTKDNRLVDMLDLSIPPGPTTPDTQGATAPYTPVPYEYVPGRFTNANTVPGTPSGVAARTPATYQLTIIGGFTDAFHFYPVIIRGNVATIYPHHNLLEYGRTYRVEIDPGVLTLADGSFTGFGAKDAWTFSTKASGPRAGLAPLILSHPTAVTVAAGETATFSVTAAGIPRPALQWFKNGAALTGATMATLKLERARAGDAGSYTMTATNSSGSATSRPAALSVR